MAISVTDAFSNRDAHIDEARRILGSSSKKWSVFEAVYRGKKKRKSVEDIASALGLTNVQVLNVGGPLARSGLFRQEGRNPTFYVKIDEIAHIRDRIIPKKGSNSRTRKGVQTPTPRGNPPRQRAKPVKARPAVMPPHLPTPIAAYDVFISHAREDKADFVKGLAERINAEGIKVWYDSFSLKWGDKLRESIDRGLAKSRFGIVVLSPAFLKKPWPKEELNGLFELEMAGRTRILPIWHNLTHGELVDYSPTLAGRLALHSDHPIDDMIEQLKELLET